MMTSRVAPVNSACRAAQRSACVEPSDPSTPTTMRACPSLPDPFIALLASSLTRFMPYVPGSADDRARLAARTGNLAVPGRHEWLPAAAGCGAGGLCRGRGDVAWVRAAGVEPERRVLVAH